MANTKGDQTRAEILEAAKRLILRQGYNATSMRDIAKEAGDRAVAGIYNHFPNKEAIYLALLDTTNPYQEILSALETAAGDTGPELIANALRKTMPLLMAHWEFLELVLVDMREFQGQNLRDLIQRDVLPRLFAMLQQVTQMPGMQHIEPIVLTRLAASIVLGYVATRRAGPLPILDLWSEAAWIEHYIHMFLHGIASGTASETSPNPPKE